MKKKHLLVIMVLGIFAMVPLMRYGSSNNLTIPQEIIPSALTKKYGASYRQNEIINTVKLHEAGITGERILIGVIDTGFRTTHEAFSQMKLLSEYDFVSNDNVTRDVSEKERGQEFHGTAVLGSMSGYIEGKLIGSAYGASYALAKAEIAVPDNPELAIEEEYYIRAINWFDSLGVDIITSSLVFHKLDDVDYYRMEQMDGKTATITKVADEAVKRGIVFINGVGNGFQTDWKIAMSPADGFDVLSVGAVDLNENLTNFSSTGPTVDGRMKPDFLAPGLDVFTTGFQTDTTYRTIGGTSIACPLSAGVIALMLSARPELSPSQVKEALISTADRSDSPENRYGYGLIDAVKAVTYFGPAFSNTPKVEKHSSGYKISTSILSTYGINKGTAKITYWTDNNSNQKAAPLNNTQNDSFETVIPTSAGATSINFSLTAADSKGQVTEFPGKYLGSHFTFNMSKNKLQPLPLRKQKKNK